MKKYALIKNQIVENIIVAEEGYVDPNYDAILLEEDFLVEIGCKYINSVFIDREKTPEELEVIRIQKLQRFEMERSALLDKSDIIMLKDNWEKLTEQQQNDWIVYRQALRDITLQDGFPDNIVWPEKP